MRVLRAFASAFVAGRYGDMWALESTTARSAWAGQAAFASFYRTKFAPVVVKGVTVGAPGAVGATVRIPLSIDLAWRAAGPPGVLDLFDNVEAVLMPTPSGWRVQDAGPLAADGPIIPPAMPPQHAISVPILMYHHISNAPPPAPSQIGLTVTDGDFAAELDYLAAHGYHTIRLVDLFDALYYGLALPPRPIVLTFDDGYSDAYTDAFPLLVRHHMLAEFNIITAFAGQTVGVNSYMTWAQIERMAAQGMEMESHTIDHEDLGIIGAQKDSYELRFSRSILASHVHRAVQFLAYPSGEPFRSGTVAAQQQILALLPQYGYVGALLDPNVPSTIQDARLPYELPRVRVSPGESIAEFAAGLG